MRDIGFLPGGMRGFFDLSSGSIHHQSATVALSGMPPQSYSTKERRSMRRKREHQHYSGLRDVEGCDCGGGGGSGGDEEEEALLDGDCLLGSRSDAPEPGETLAAGVSGGDGVTAAASGRRGTT